MTTASDALRAQLLSVVSRLCTSGTNDGVSSTPGIKQELEQVLSLIAVLHSDTRTTLEQAVALLDSSNPSSGISALPLVAQAAASLSSPPIPSVDAAARLPLLPQAAPLPPSRTFPLPIELTSHILDLVYPSTEYKERQATLMSMALVSRAFYRAARIFLEKELAITNAKQFRGLSSKLELDASALDNVKFLNLDFDVMDLRCSLAQHPEARKWLSLLAADVLHVFKDQSIVTFGPDLIRSWLLDVDMTDIGLPIFLHERIEFSVRWLTGSDALIRMVWPEEDEGGQLRHNYWILNESLDWGRDQLGRFELVAPASARMLSHDSGSRRFRQYGRAWTDFNAPHLMITPQQLLQFFTPSSRLERLSFTLGIHHASALDFCLQDLDAFFAQLAPTVRHLDIRFVANHHPHSVEISDRIIELLKSLPHLKSLGIGGDIPLGEFSGVSHLEGGVISTIASLPLTELRLFISRSPPFSYGIGRNIDTILMEDTEEGGLHFAELRKLMIEYKDEEEDCLPLSSAIVCRDRGIELTFCKVE